jgi:predicted dinucleotide-binding enzyme
LLADASEEMVMRIGILGAGRMGVTIGTVLSYLGREVIFSYSRSEKKLRDLAAAAGPLARAGTPTQIAKEAEVVVLAVHWSQLDDVLAQAGPLDGKIVLSRANPLDLTDSELVVAHTDSGAETIARKLPRLHVVAACQAATALARRGFAPLRDRFSGPSRRGLTST